MNDAHVEALHYDLVPSEHVSFADSAPPVERELPGFRVRLADGKVTVTMHDHYATEAEARREVDWYLHTWRVDASFATNRPQFEFKFVKSKIVDRDPPPPPPPPGSVHVSSGAGVLRLGGGNATVHISRGEYPDPPDGFAVDPDTETLWNRWQGYIEGREPLETMAYACLTMLQMDGGRAGASTRFSISCKVLGKLATLSTDTGDASTARKVTRRLRPRTGAEQTWLEAAVKVLVRRAGKVAAAPGATLPQIRMSDLPKL